MICIWFLLNLIISTHISSTNRYYSHYMNLLICSVLVRGDLPDEIVQKMQKLCTLLQIIITKLLGGDIIATTNSTSKLPHNQNILFGSQILDICSYIEKMNALIFFNPRHFWSMHGGQTMLPILCLADSFIHSIMILNGPKNVEKKFCKLQVIFAIDSRMCSHE